MLRAETKASTATSWDQALTYCRNKTKASKSNFYYSFFVLPQPQRDAIMVLYALCRELDDIVDNDSIYKIQATDPSINSNNNAAAEQLAWWRAELDRAYQNQAQHPIAVALMHLKDKFGLSAKYLQDLITGMAMDLPQNKALAAEPASIILYSQQDLSTYCYHVASTVGLLVNELLGHTSEPLQQFAYQLGQALQMVNIIRDVKADFLNNRVYLPASWLEQHGLALSDLPQCLRALQSPAGLTPQHPWLLAIQHTRQQLAALAEQNYQAALDLINQHPEAKQDHKVSLIMAKTYFKLLAKIKQSAYDYDFRARLNMLDKIKLGLEISINQLANLIA